MNFTETIFLIQIIIIVALFLSKLYNVFRLGEWYSFEISIILFIAWFIVYGLGFITLMTSSESANLALYSSIFSFETWTLLFNAFFFLFEIFFMLKRRAIDTRERNEESYNALKNR